MQFYTVEFGKNLTADFTCVGLFIGVYPTKKESNNNNNMFYLAQLLGQYTNCMHD